MILYLDSSVVLRIVLSEPNPLADWTNWDSAYASRILLVEGARTLERVALAGDLTADGVERRRRDFLDAVARVELLDIDHPVLDRAAAPMGRPLKTLDAIHLATAMELRSAMRLPGLVFATHDRQLATAAAAAGFETTGVDRA